MQIELKSIAIRDLIDGYSNDADTGVKGYGGKLDIRPPYQREFRYDLKQQQAVVETILKGFPLNIMYWSVGEDGNYEMIDGQQRTLSICEFFTHGFNIEDKDRGTLYFSTLTNEEKEKFLGYMDLAFGKLVEHDIPVFTISHDKINLKEVTMEDFVDFDLPAPSNEERQKCWEYFAKDYELDDDCDLLEMTIKFIFTPGKVSDALKHARTLATMDKLEKIPRALLFKGCNAQMSSELSQKATRVEAKFGFNDIVMNADQRETITHVIEQMNFKKKVYEQWDYTKKYPYGRGLTVLLFGAPGTGKSMMAQVLAHELNLELYRVDISKVVDKYVGETEKSLSMIFREAKKCNVVLFFDECDTIFAKRSDDGGSNQASANNKTALLLQEMEAYDGVCVLATNYKHNIDPAFFRRMKYIVEFQFPDPDTREMLWRTTIPKTTPLNEDVNIRFLAERFEFAGGNIKNCILNAAFLAAADGDGKEVCMRHYLQAIKYEFVKTGKVFTKADFEPYAYMVGLGEDPDELDDDFM